MKPPCVTSGLPPPHVILVEPSSVLRRSHPVQTKTILTRLPALLRKDVYGNLTVVAAFQRRLCSQGKRHVGSQECSGTLVSQPPHRRAPGRRADGGECPLGSLHKIRLSIYLGFFHLNFVRTYRLTQESSV